MIYVSILQQVTRKNQLKHMFMYNSNYHVNLIRCLVCSIAVYFLTIGSYVSVCSSRYEAHGKFGEHERCARVARGVAKSNFSFLSALQTSQVLHISMNTQLMYEPIVHGKIMSVHNRNMKHAHIIEFDLTNLLAML